MSFFQFFQILHAIHFVLAIPAALVLWIHIFGVLGVFSMPQLTAGMLSHALGTAVLAGLWYYAWLGSIVFALRGIYPMFSIRANSLVLASVYGGLAIAHIIRSKAAFPDSMLNHPVFTAIVVTMLLVAACGITFLPQLKIAADRENARLAQEREQSLNSLNAWGNRSLG